MDNQLCPERPDPNRATVQHVRLFNRRGTGAGRLRKRLDADMRELSGLAERYAGAADDGSFDMLGFAIRAFELSPTDDVDHLVDRGIDGSEFFLRELRPNWRDLTREQRTEKIASFVRFANLLCRSESDEPPEDSAATERLAELRACVRTKIVMLAVAYDIEYDDSFGRRIARNPQGFGDYELSHA